MWGAMASEVNLPWTHPLYRGLTGHMFGTSSRRTVQDADAVVICGTYVFPDVFPLLESPFRADAKVVHIDLDSYAIGKNHPVSLGLVSDPKLTMRALANALTDRMTDAQKAAARSRAERIAAETAACARHRRSRRMPGGAAPCPCTSRRSRKSWRSNCRKTPSSSTRRSPIRRS